MEKRKAGLIFSVLLALLLTLSLAPVSFAASSTKFTIALSTNQIQFRIPAGTQFNGSIATTGMVRFWGSGPNGTQVVNLGIVDKSATFSFNTTASGIYTFNFENDLPNTITVTFTYTSNPPLPETGTGALTTYLLVAIVAVAIGGSLLIIFLVRRKIKKVTELQAKQP